MKTKNIVQAFKDLINRIVDTIKQALSRGSLTAYQREYLQMEQRQAEKIRDMFLSALDTAASHYKSQDASPNVDSTIKYSISNKKVARKKEAFIMNM